jgi:hypothetical protein
MQEDLERGVISVEVFSGDWDPEDWAAIEPVVVRRADGSEHVELPAKRVVCPRCEGKGTHVNPNVDGHGLTREDFERDPDFLDDYMRGVFDVTCYECDGARVTLEVDRERAPKVALDFFDDYMRGMAEMAATEAAERRMGA